MIRENSKEEQYEDGYCNTKMAISIFTKIKGREINPNTVESALRLALKKGEVRGILVGNKIIWKIETVKSFSKNYKLNDERESTAVRIRFTEEVFDRIRQIVREEIQSAFK